MNKPHSYTHFIKLTPYGKFFFGGESFSDKNETTFYFQKSKIFPQQTAILGLLRYQLLVQNNYLDAQGRMVKNGSCLIGGDSFDPEKQYGFGAIKNTSPVFLVDKGGERYLPFPKLKVKSSNELLTPEFENSASATASLNGSAKPLFLLKDFNYKEGFEHGYQSIDSDKYLKHREVFNPDLKPHIGIFKTDTLEHRRTEEEDADRQGFFKLQYQQFQKGFHFGFYANLSLSEQQVLGNADLVYLGKERSAFKMEVTPIQNSTEDATEKSSAKNSFPTQTEFAEGDLVWTLADAYVNTTELYPHCTAVVSADKSFRCLISNVRNESGDSEHFNYFSKPVETHVIDKKIKRMRRSARYNLLKRGSLLLVGDAVGFNQAIQNNNFFTIGYNHFIKL